MATLAEELQKWVKETGGPTTVSELTEQIDSLLPKEEEKEAEVTDVRS